MNLNEFDSWTKLNNPRDNLTFGYSRSDGARIFTRGKKRKSAGFLWVP